MTFLLKISYDGSSFSGWQRLPNARTVQGVIEAALTKMLNEPITIDGAGRTDAGVHALGQYASFSTTRKISLEKMQYAIGNFMPQDIQIVNVREIDASKHARFHAMGKIYGYKMTHKPTPFNSKYKAALPAHLDEIKVRTAMKFFTGTHDFRTFMASGSKIQNTIRTISRFELMVSEEEWYFEIEGDGFLYNMVRIIIGTLIDVGLGKIAPEEILEIIESYNRDKAKHTAPSCGLYLVDVLYPEEMSMKS